MLPVCERDTVLETLQSIISHIPSANGKQMSIYAIILRSINKD